MASTPQRLGLVGSRSGRLEPYVVPQLRVNRETCTEGRDASHGAGSTRVTFSR